MAVKAFSIGDRGVHKLFGKGTILEIDALYDTVENNTKLTIEFSGKTRKKIVAKFIKHA